jgi:hypothetical protein
MCSISKIQNWFEVDTPRVKTHEVLANLFKGLVVHTRWALVALTQPLLADVWHSTLQALTQPPP